MRSSYYFSFDDPIPGDDPSVMDECGEKSGPEPEPTSKLIGTDPPIDDDEWGSSAVTSGKGIPAVNEEAGGNVVEDERLRELKRVLVDAVYGWDIGFLASYEVRDGDPRACVTVEAANPNPRQSSAWSYLVETGFCVYNLLQTSTRSPSWQYSIRESRKDWPIN